MLKFKFVFIRDCLKSFSNLLKHFSVVISLYEDFAANANSLINLN